MEGIAVKANATAVGDPLETATGKRRAGPNGIDDADGRKQEYKRSKKGARISSVLPKYSKKGQLTKEQLERIKCLRRVEKGHKVVTCTKPFAKIRGGNQCVGI